MVWRYVEPGKPSALEGPHSIAPKAATSGARINGARRVLTEVCGAFGWRLSLDEVKWLFDWHLVRGNNLINPHAVFYSIRDRRAYESEPDLGIHNVFWPYFQQLAVYARRLSWLLCDGEHVCDIAILGDGNALPWQAAKQLYRNQIDFLYIDDRAVAEGHVEKGSIQIGVQTYRAVIVDGPPEISDSARKKLDAFTETGGLVYDAEIDIPETDAVSLDLGRVGDIAEIRVDGEWAGLRMWAPYRIDLGAGIAPGPHRLEIRVTNTMANAYEGLQAPSGLIGPVHLITRASI